MTDSAAQDIMEAEVVEGSEAVDRDLQLKVQTNQTETADAGSDQEKQQQADPQQQQQQQQQQKVEQFDQSVPQQRNRQQSLSQRLPAWVRKLGYNFNCEDVDEVHECVNYLLYARVAQVFLALVAWACATSSVSKLNDIAGGTSLNFASAARWALVVTLFALLYVLATGFAGFKTLGASNSERLSGTFALASLLGDVGFTFATFSAFSSTATLSILVNQEDNPLDLGVIGAAAAFSFFLWVSFMYSVPLAFIAWKDVALMKQHSGASASGPPPSGPEGQSAEVPNVANV